MRLFLFLTLIGLLIPASQCVASNKEDWSTPLVDRSQLTPIKPLVVEHADYAGFTREMVQVQWRAGDPIYLHLMIPKAVKKPPVILYLYTHATETDRFLREKFDQALVEGGYAAVGFSAALEGHRYHDRPMTQWFISEMQEALASSAHDVQMILDYLQTRRDVDVDRAGMFGEGSGGAIAVLASSVDRRLKAIDLLNPWGAWPEWLAHSPVVPDDERSDYLKPAFLEGIATLDPVRWLPRLTIPVRIQFMPNDEATPQIARQKIEAAAPSQAVIIPGDQALAEYRANNGATFLNWIKRQLSAEHKAKR